MICYIGVGANVGNRLKYIKKALRFLKQVDNIELRKVSDIFETEPIGGPKYQKKYYNLVIEIETKLLPKELLILLKGIERKTGRRKRKSIWAQREIDLDILGYGKKMIKEPGLVIPHSRMHTRAFVLKPFSDLAPKWRHPVFGKNVTTLFKGLKEDVYFRRVKANV